MYQAQQFTAKVISGRVCPDRYRSIPTTLLQLKAPLAASLLRFFNNGLDSDGLYSCLTSPLSNPSALITHLIISVCFISNKPVSGSLSNVTPRNPAMSSSCSRSTPSSHNCIAELLISSESLLQKMMSSTETTQLTLVPTKRQGSNFNCSNPQATSFSVMYFQNAQGLCQSPSRVFFSLRTFLVPSLEC
jgi:hypothetical protein